MSPSQRPPRESASFGRVLLTFTVTLTVLLGLGLGIRALTAPQSASSDVADSDTSVNMNGAATTRMNNDAGGEAVVSLTSGPMSGRSASAITPVEGTDPPTDAAASTYATASNRGTPSTSEVVSNREASLSGETVEPLTRLETGAPEEPSVEIAGTEPVGPVDFKTAEATFYDGDYAQASVLFAAYLQDHDDNPWGYYMKGLADWKANDLDAAENALLDCLDRNPDHMKALINLARVRIENDKAEEAIVPIERALSLDPDHGAAMRVHARVLHSSGRRAEAESAYLAVIRNHEEDAWSMNNLGLIRIESKDFSRAVPPLARAVAIDSSVACFHNNLGVALEGVGDYRGALDAYVNAVDTDPAYVKSVLSRDRVSGIVDRQSRESINLAGAADEFVDELRGGHASAEVDVEIAGEVELAAPRVETTASGSTP